MHLCTVTGKHAYNKVQGWAIFLRYKCNSLYLSSLQHMIKIREWKSLSMFAITVHVVCNVMYITTIRN